MRGLVHHGDLHRARVRVADGVAHRFLGNAQQLVLMLGLQSGRHADTFEGAGHATGHRRALGELLQRQFQPGAARLIQAQRHDRTPCFRQAIARQIADARVDRH